VPTPLPNTAGMIYPSWYPDCLRIAADVTTTQVTAEIDATTGTMIRPALAGSTVWATTQSRAIPVSWRRRNSL
jgi:hypothetical protein